MAAQVFRDRELPLQTYDIDEMLGAKLRELVQRDQSRDFFDLDHALTRPSQGHVADPDRIIHAFRKYMKYMAGGGSSVDADAFRRDPDRKLRLETFEADVGYMLRNGVTFDIDAAAERVRRDLFDRLDPKQAESLEALEG